MLEQYSTKSNPFQIGFVRLPSRQTNINTGAVLESILDDLSSEFPSIPVREITGARGSGKTVILEEIRQNLAKDSQLSKMTKAYSFGYQLLGYLLWEYLSKSKVMPNESELADMIKEPYFTKLIEYSYDKLYSELSAKDIEVINVLADFGGEDVKVAKISEAIGMTNNTMSTYRQRLEKGGVIDTSHFGHFSFALPYFKEFVELMR